VNHSIAKAGTRLGLPPIDWARNSLTN